MKVFISERAKQWSKIQDIQRVLDNIHRWTGVYAATIAGYDEDERAIRIEMSCSNTSIPTTCHGGLKIHKNLVDLPIVTDCTIVFVDGTAATFAVRGSKSILIYWNRSLRRSDDFDDAITRIGHDLEQDERGSDGNSDSP